MAKKSEHIKLEALSLHIDETTRGIMCPWCADRHDVERGSFVVTRLSEGLVYKCHRAKCSHSGFIPTVGWELTRKKEKVFEPKYLRRPLKKLPIKVRNWLAEKYLIDRSMQELQEFKYDFTENRLYMPIYDLLSREMGGVSKKLPERLATIETDMDKFHQGEKAIAYWFEDVPKLHFPKRQECEWKVPITLVEDIPSAIRVQSVTGRVCVSLLGSGLTNEQVGYLTSITDHIILALDADTWDRRKQKGGKALSIAYYELYSLFFKRFEMRIVSKDPKDMTDDEILNEVA